MSKIDKIYVLCCQRDFFLTKICVASIRFWYPEIPIILVKDHTCGDFNTGVLERKWNVSLLKTSWKKRGWGFAKLEVLFLDNRERALILDSDTVFAGKVLEVLEAINEDFIVDTYIDKSEDVRAYFYDLDKLAVFDPEFVYPGFVFNTGLFVARCGKIKREAFSDYVEWSEPPVLKKKDIFKCGEQGMLNHMLVKKMETREISLKSFKFNLWANGDDVKKIDLACIKNRQGYPYVIHWAGPKGQSLSGFSRNDILRFYSRFYYSRFKWGFILYFFDMLADMPIFYLKRQEIS